MKRAISFILIIAILLMLCSALTGCQIVIPKDTQPTQNNASSITPNPGTSDTPETPGTNNGSSGDQDNTSNNMVFDFYGLKIQLPSTFTMTEQTSEYVGFDDGGASAVMVQLFYYDNVVDGPQGSNINEICDFYYQLYANEYDYVAFKGTANGTPYVFLDKGCGGFVLAFYSEADRFWVVSMYTDIDNGIIDPTNEEMIDTVTGWNGNTSSTPNEYPEDFLVMNYNNLIIVLDGDFKRTDTDQYPDFENQYYDIHCTFQYNANGFTASDIQTFINSTKRSLTAQQYTVTQGVNNGISYLAVYDGDNNCFIIAFYHDGNFYWEATITHRTAYYDWGYMLETITGWHTDVPNDSNSSNSGSSGNNNGGQSSSGSNNNTTPGGSLDHLIGTNAPAISNPKVGVPYKLGMNQYNLGKRLYFNGNTLDRSWYLTTTENPYEAVDVYLEHYWQDGCYRLYFWQGTEKMYIDIHLTDTGHVNIRLTTSPIAIFTWNSDYNTLQTLFIPGIDEPFFIGNYDNWTELQACNMVFMLEDFPAHLYETEQTDLTPESPVNLFDLPIYSNKDVITGVVNSLVYCSELTDIDGWKHTDCYEICGSTSERWVRYELNGQYTTVGGWLYDANSSGGSGWLEFYDGTVFIAATPDIGNGCTSAYFEIDITGVEYLTVRFCSTQAGTWMIADDILLKN